MTQTHFCSELSRTADEAIFGTAGNGTDVWFVLEYPGLWGAKALEESRLSPEIQTHLQQAVAATPGARLQLIKRGPEPSGERLHFFIGLSDEAAPRLYRFGLAAFDELLNLDLPGLVAALRSTPERFADRLHPEPLFLVCTNGSRDRCCAKWGVPVYLSLAARAGEQVWQTTHTGGHRFAATLICLPHGLYYGRLGPQDAAPLAASLAAGDVYRLDRYRGRSCYQQPVQAAEYYLRRETGIQALGGFAFLAAEQDGAVWTCRFRSQGDGLIHELFVLVEESDFANPLSCSKTKTETVPQYRLLSYTVGESTPLNSPVKPI